MKLVELLVLLRSIEWQGDERIFVCPACRASKQHGHMPGCTLARRIAEAEDEAMSQ